MNVILCDRKRDNWQIFMWAQHSRLNLPADKLPVQAPYEMTGPDSSVI